MEYDFENQIDVKYSSSSTPSSSASSTSESFMNQINNLKTKLSMPSNKQNHFVDFNTSTIPNSCSLIFSTAASFNINQNVNTFNLKINKFFSLTLSFRTQFSTRGNPCTCWPSFWPITANRVYSDRCIHTPRTTWPGCGPFWTLTAPLTWAKCPFRSTTKRLNGPYKTTTSASPTRSFSPELTKFSATRLWFSTNTGKI